ncbi:MAG: hypothetical protein K0S33_188 [Bacteroidetes bacterium]|jgi:hypothetical protein|nr:hypothetical protein [Bacteroidota bacterium]
MIKKYAFLLLLTSLFFPSFAQNYYNEWINYGQSYYKVPIFKDGVYKIDSLKLAQAGIPVGTINPQNIQLFHKGQELYIHIEGENDGVFNGSDYILFYAEKNTAKDDSALYTYGTFLCNPYFSVINDTSAVFITWNNSTANHRLIAETDTTFSSFTPSPYFIKEDVQAFNNEYCEGPENGIGATDPRYAAGEGFMQWPFDMGYNSAFTFNTAAIYTTGPLPSVSITHAGRSNPFYTPDHTVMIEFQDISSNWQQLINFSYDGYKVYKNDFVLNPSLIGSNFTLRLNNVSNPSYDPWATVMCVYYAKLIFPSTFDLLGANRQMMHIPDAGSQSKSLLTISNFTDASGAPVLMDLSNHRLIPVVQNAGTYNALVPNSGGQKKCYLAAGTNIDTVLNIRPVNGNGTFVDYSLQATDSAYLIVTHSSLLNATNQYANYRRSAAGGSHNVLVAEIGDLSDQFAYGVNRHPFSIRHFSEFLIDTYTSRPKNLLLMGKSLHGSICINDPAHAALCLVPSMGYPAADNLLTQGLVDPASLAPAIATGRISAPDETTVTNYLNKIILHESQQPGQAWQKDVLHFVGGITNYEQTIFNSYMNQNKITIEDTLYGGNVHTFKKTSTAPIAINTNDSIKQLIESGVSLITFFGHGSTSGFEQNIDDPYSFDNSPKFPLLVANSCYTGDIHTTGIISASEKFVLAEDHGTIGFIASVSAGVSYALQIYTNEFYKNLSYRKYGKSYGECVQETVRQTEIIPSSLNDSIVKITCLEMSFEGDPAVRPNVSPRPDFVLTNSDVIINTDSLVDSINVRIHFNNYGSVVNDTIKVYIERTLPSGSVVPFYKTIISPSYSTSLNFNIDKDIISGVGLNKFYVKVDFFNDVQELNETNNATIGQISAFVRGGDVVPVYPYNYAVVPNLASIVLKASTADAFAPQWTYRVQVDTSDAFSNPIMNSTFTSVGGVLSIPVTLHNRDSAVYFWRVGKDSSNVNAINWRESSFQTILNKNGWGQAHFHQFKNDKYQFVSYNKPIRRFEFKNNVRTVFCRTGWVASPNPPYLNFAENGYYFDNAQQNYWTCGNGVGWSFAVFDSISGIPEKADTATVSPWGFNWLSQYNSCVCTDQIRTVFDFGLYNQCGDFSQIASNDPLNMTMYMQRMEDFLNAVPVGDYVLAYSHNNDSCHAFPPSLHTAFSRIGSDSIQFKRDTLQMIIFGQKKASPHTGAQEVMGDSLLDIITLTDTFSTKWNNGYIASEIIGPALQWRSLHWRYTSLETPSTDSIYIKVVGIRANGQRDTVATFFEDSLDVLALNNYVNVAVYPYIQLIAFEADYSNNTAPQLKRWQVLYDEVPEAAVNPIAGYSINKTVLPEGDNLVIKLPIQNIGKVPFTDSLLVTYWVEDASGVEHVLPYKLKKAPFLPDSVFMDTIVFNTLGYQGMNALWVDVNALNHPKNQLEQFHFNNILRIPFKVDGDRVNPLLDVTFDGVHILNGDIVSPKPEILISLKDENKFLALNDTADFSVKIKYPGASVEQNLYFGQVLQFTPAQLPNNSCKIEYRPASLGDGKHELIVQARDRSSNISGASEYKIQFEVINKSTITEVLNYPNPFSTSTRFVFTLTGSQVPETFKIQVMTISGKVVREITKEEIGTIKIGRNITEFAWNGKDEFGDQLANGVYLYRVVTRINGETIEKRETAADDYFKKGWGKLVIIR